MEHHREVTVIFLITDLAACLPSPEDWPAVWAARRAAQLEALAAERRAKRAQVGAVGAVVLRACSVLVLLGASPGWLGG